MLNIALSFNNFSILLPLCKRFCDFWQIVFHKKTPLFSLSSCKQLKFNQLMTQFLRKRFRTNFVMRLYYQLIWYYKPDLLFPVKDCLITKTCLYETPTIESV